MNNIELTREKTIKITFLGSGCGMQYRENENKMVPTEFIDISIDNGPSQRFWIDDILCLNLKLKAKLEL